MSKYVKINNNKKMMDEKKDDSICNTNIIDSINIEKIKKDSIASSNKINAIKISTEINSNDKLDLISKSSSSTSINDLKIL